MTEESIAALKGRLFVLEKLIHENHIQLDTLIQKGDDYDRRRAEILELIEAAQTASNTGSTSNTSVTSRN